MFATIEVRWFFSGILPVSISNWFSVAAGPSLFEETRTDKYLLLPSRPDLGIKIRYQNFEIKSRTNSYGATKFTNSTAGRIEGWRKWSFSLPEKAFERESQLVNGIQRVDIRKKRLQNWIEWVEGCAIKVGDMGDVTSSGCSVELTHVELLDQPYWTMGFESFGRSSDLFENLVHTAELVLNTDGAPHLPLAASLSYPQWLMREFP